ncbi:MAG: RagB/SusD family nutrient uptake outer membrane protein [Proteiniphilum sp.]|jgi:hypothetical protein|nr:RagB/SusD family nutrient uptake outer membrane protein [Proteiniphilum sp.]
MKNKKIYMVYLLSLLLCSACNDWLDVDPVDRVKEDKQFSSEDNIKSALNGLYWQLAGQNLYGGQLSQTTLEAMAHYYVYASEQGAIASDVIHQIAYFNYTGDRARGKFADIWTNAYTTLLNINNYIKGVNESSAVMSEAHRNILLGEAYGLRAYLHFDLYRLFCPYDANPDNKVLPYNRDASIVLNHDGYEENVYSTPGEYVALLLKDIAEAERLLADDPIRDPSSESITSELSEDFYKNRNRRMNYYAVKGLEARVLQYIGRDADAAAAAKIITDLVEADEVFQWVNNNEISTAAIYNYIFFSEVVFGINNKDFGARATEWYLRDNVADEVYVVNEKNLLNNIFPEYQGSLDAIIDVRSYQWKGSPSNVLPSSVGRFPTDASYVSLKYKTVSEKIPAIRNLQPLMRFPEMYYIRTEAALKAGDRTDAVNMLNAILAKRGVTEQYLLSENISENEIRAHLTREYYREFFGEGQVWYYHKRIQSPAVFNGSAAGSVNVNPGNAFVVPIPDKETNI